MTAPEQIWLDWPDANKNDVVYDEPPERDTQPGQTAYIRADIHAAALDLLAMRDAELARVREALAPSGDTKAAYMGEIKDPDTKRMVSWTAIKMVMKMITARAALTPEPEGDAG